MSKSVSEWGFYNSSNCHTGLEKNTIHLACALKARGNPVCLFAPADSFSADYAGRNHLEVVPVESSDTYVSLRLARKLANKLKVRHCSVLIIARPRDIITGLIVRYIYRRSVKLVFYQQTALSLRGPVFIYRNLFSRIDLWLHAMLYLRRQIETIARLKDSRFVHIPPVILPEKPRPERSLARQALRLPSDSFIAGSNHRFTPKNRLDFLIRCVQFLKKNNYVVHLLLQGDASTSEEVEYLEFLKELARECEVSQYIHFRVQADDGHNFLPALNLYVQPVVCPPYDTRIIRALKNGVPVLVPFSETSRELLHNGKYGLLYKMYDLENFAARMIRIITQSRISSHLSSIGQEHANSAYSPAHCCETLEVFLQANAPNMPGKSSS